MRRAGQRGFGREHVAHGGNQRGRIVLHVLAHDLLRDVERELRDVGGQIVLDGRHGLAERRGERRELRGLFARVGLTGFETLFAALLETGR